MIFEASPLAGAYVISEEPHHDERGFFARTWCQREFEQHGLNPRVVQCNVSFNAKKGTWRGMHYQVAPKAQPKLVRCTAGAVFDCIIDLRPDSPTYCKWFGVELSAQNHRSLFIPAGFAHGFQTLSDNAELLYDMFEWYAPETARGVRYNDPAFSIHWPIEVSVISDRDATYPDYQK